MAVADEPLVVGVDCEYRDEPSAWIEWQKKKAEERNETHKQNDKELLAKDKATARERRPKEQSSHLASAFD